MSDIRITLNPNQASKMLEVLSAFPSFKRPKDLPDYLRLSKEHIKRVKKWQKMALQNMETPTFSGTNKITAGAFRLFQDKKLFTVDKKSEEKGEKCDVKSEEKGEKCDKKSQEKEEKCDKKTDLLFGDDSDEDSMEFKGDIGNIFGELFASMGKQALGKPTPGKSTTGKSTPGKPTTGKPATAQGSKQTVGGDKPGEVIPMMTGMVNKKLMYDPYKANTCALEEWIAENRQSVGTKELKTREKQLNIMKQILMLYDQEEEGESHKIREARNMEILELVTECQELGDLPPEVELKAKEYYQEADFNNLVPGMMEALQGTMASVFMGLGKSLQQTNVKGKEEEEDCTIL